MPYDPEERCYKIATYSIDGELAGYFELTMPQLDMRCWPGRPQPRHFEVLYRLEGGSRPRYLVLYRFGTEITDWDYARLVTDAVAARWLEEEGFPLDEPLSGASPADPLAASAEAPRAAAPEAPAATRRLTDDQLEVWNALEGRAFSAKELARTLTGRVQDEELIRKRIQAIRATGRKVLHQRGIGYHRPDAPPPEPT